MCAFFGGTLELLFFLSLSILYCVILAELVSWYAIGSWFPAARSKHCNKMPQTPELGMLRVFFPCDIITVKKSDGVCMGQ